MIQLTEQGAKKMGPGLRSKKTGVPIGKHNYRTSPNVARETSVLRKTTPLGLDLALAPLLRRAARR